MTTTKAERQAPPRKRKRGRPRLGATCWIIRFREIHGAAYDYRKARFGRSDDPIEIGCRSCGTTFRMRPEDHARKARPQGCPTCGMERSIEAARNRARERTLILAR